MPLCKYSATAPRKAIRLSHVGLLRYVSLLTSLETVAEHLRFRWLLLLFRPSRIFTPLYLFSKKFLAVIFLTFFLLAPEISHALRPEQVLVLANRNAAKSVGLAKYYMEKRGIPKENLLKLWVTDKEVCSREEYDKKIAAPIRNHIVRNNLQKTIRCLVVFYGLPLRVKAPLFSPKEQHNLDRLHTLKETAAENKQKKPDQGLQNRGASVDSELTLVMAGDYPLKGWLINPNYLGVKGQKTPVSREQVLLVSRLDGSSDTIVKRVIDDSLETEKIGLKGTAYFDARWPDPGDKKVSGYSFYDRSIHRSADFFKKNALLPVVLEKTQALFQNNDCPNAALYCGWYSLGKYIDAFTWQKGSIGYHIASSECTTLKKKKSKIWCKMMLEKGVAVTIGPVAEPYVQAFPVPEIFFRLMAEHRLSVVESYYLSLPYLSWQMVLIGDPLYRPFVNRSNN